MNLLILGGTEFLGRHLVSAALKMGHQVTLFNRGQTNPNLFPDVEKLRGDRDGSLESVQGRYWDAVIDPSGYVPRVVRGTLDVLRDAAKHYTFISSISVYDDFSVAGMDEGARVGKMEDETDENIEEQYGPLKALCEKEVLSVFGSSGLVVRPGLIVGPYDPTNRFTYWVKRFSEGGEILIPGTAAKALQFIDVRDLANWMIRSVESGTGGVFNATGPDYSLTMGDFVAELQRVIPSTVETTWVDEEFLLSKGVEQFVELPLWIADQTNWPGFQTVSIQKAIASGLSFRPLHETISDTLEWAQSQTEKQPSIRPQGRVTAGMSKVREADLLQEWNSL